MRVVIADAESAHLFLHLMVVSLELHNLLI